MQGKASAQLQHHLFDPHLHTGCAIHAVRYIAGNSSGTLADLLDAVYLVAGPISNSSRSSSSNSSSSRRKLVVCDK